MIKETVCKHSWDPKLRHSMQPLFVWPQMLQVYAGFIGVTFIYLLFWRFGGKKPWFSPACRQRSGSGSGLPMVGSVERGCSGMWFLKRMNIEYLWDDPEQKRSTMTFLEKFIGKA